MPLTIYGIRTVAASLEGGRVIEITREHGSKNPRVLDIERRAREGNIPVKIAPRAALDRLAQGGLHQGVAAAFEPPSATLEAACALDKPLVLLDGVTDPGNLGSILRTARAFDAGAVVVPRRNSAPLSPVVARVSCGGAATVPLIRVGNVARALSTARKAGRWVVAACETGDESIFECALPAPICWVLGDEGGGVRALTRRQCDHIVRIPTVEGSPGCLNVAAVFAICMAASARPAR